MKVFVQKLLKTVLWVFLCLLILFAILIQLGRELFPEISHYRADLERFLSKTLRAEVTISAVSGVWDGLRPQITVQGLTIQGESDVPVFSIEDARFELGIISSLKQRRFYWRDVELNDLSLFVYQTPKGSWAVEGFEFKGNQRSRMIDDPFDIFLFGRQVAVNDVKLALRFENGTSDVIRFPSMYMENSDRFHRLTIDALNASGSELEADSEEDDLFADLDATLEKTREFFTGQNKQRSAGREFDGSPPADGSSPAKGSSRPEGSLPAGSYDDTQSSQARLIVEGTGDPRIDQTFSAKAYLQLKNLQLTEVLDFFPASIAKHFEALDREGLRSREVNTEVWASGSQQFGYDWRGYLKVEGEEKISVGSVSLPRVFETQYEGGWQPNEYVELRLPEFSFLSKSYALNVPLQARYRFDEKLELSVAQLDAAKVGALLLDLTEDKSPLASVINKLSPEGRLQNVMLEIDTKRPERSRLFADAFDLSTDAYLGAPSIKQVDAMLMLGPRRGEIFIKQNQPGNLLEFQLPKLYSRPWYFSALEGSIYYQVSEDNNLLHMYSDSQRYTMLEPSTTSAIVERIKRSDDALASADAISKINGNVELSLAIPLTKNREYQGSLALTVSADQAKLQSVPYMVPDETLQDLQSYLQQAAKEGDVSDARFALRTPLRRGVDNEKIFATTSLVATASNAKVEYQPSWPLLEATRASVRLQNQEFSATISGAAIQDIAMKDLRFDVNKTKKGHVFITGRAQEPITDYIATLRNTPLKDTVATAESLIELSGSVPASVALTVPVQAPSQIAVDVEAVLLGQSGRVKAGDIRFDNALGKVSFTTERGLFADQLQVSAFGGEQKLDIDLASLVDPKLASEIRFNGDVSIPALSNWLPRPEWELSSGQTNVYGSVSFSQFQPAPVLRLQTSLQGVEIDLPKPFGKIADESRSLALELNLAKNSEYRALYDEHHLVSALMLDNSIQSLTILANEFKSSSRPSGLGITSQAWQSMDVVHYPNTIFIAGELESADFLSWMDAREAYSTALDNFAEQRSNNSEDSQPLAISAGLIVDQVMVKALPFDNVMLSAASAADSKKWLFEFEALQAKGTSVIDDSGALAIDLAYLMLPSGETSSQLDDASIDRLSEDALNQEPNPFIKDVSNSQLADIDVGSLPKARVTIDQISIGDEPYGRWSFRTRPIDDGIQFLDILGEVNGLTVGEEQDPAKLTWRQKGVQNVSEFEGRVFAKDIGKVLERFGNEAFIRTKTLRSTLSLEWRGAPDQFSFHNAKGRFSFLFRDGNFIRGADLGENPILRLFGLFNFDSVLRRLKLDFSDLAKQGYAFEKFKGVFELNYGLLKMRKPVAVESTTSKVQMVGYVDLLSYKMDTQLLVTLPVASNLTVAAALLAGIPTAIGIYAVSKLFKTQMEGVSSIVYSAKGSWGDPQLQVISVRDQ